jgi:Kef-type K+ transport system membrane component KefB
MTESLGIHALFGAFFAGYVIPKDGRLTKDISEKVEPVAGTLLLPIFFVLTGLRTSVTLIAGLGMWFYCFMVITVAVAGKLGGP